MKVGDRVKVKSVDESKKELTDYAFKYNIEDINEVFNYDRVKGLEGEITWINQVLDYIFVVLDGWSGEVIFKKAELELIC